MNYVLKSIPVRTEKPRTFGFTMAMDKGLSLREVADFIETCGDYVDIVKLGWATAYVTKNFDKKLKLYRDDGIPVYLGGTLFEDCVIRGQFHDYRNLLQTYELAGAEVSGGSITLDHKKKCDYIQILSKDVTVRSQVGATGAARIIPPYNGIEQMQRELDGGA